MPDATLNRRPTTETAPRDATRGGGTGDAAHSADVAANRTTPRAWATLAVFLALAFVTGFVGNLLQGDDVGTRYLQLDRPFWAPPQEAFGLVWPVLYVLIGIAAWRVWRVAGSVRAASLGLGLWLAQLVVNAVWPGVFFGLQAFGAAIAVIVVLDLLVLATVAVFARTDRLAAALLVPYLLWILYATALNIAIWALN